MLHPEPAVSALALALLADNADPAAVARSAALVIHEMRRREAEQATEPETVRTLRAELAESREAAAALRAEIARLNDALCDVCMERDQLEEWSARMRAVPIVLDETKRAVEPSPLGGIITQHVARLTTSGAPWRVTVDDLRDDGLPRVSCVYSGNLP